MKMFIDDLNMTDASGLLLLVEYKVYLKPQHLNQVY